MSVDQKDKVDAISTSPEGKIVLTISDHLEWDKNNEHLLILQDKINSYLEFIESGQIFDSYPTARKKSLIISICLKYEPNKAGMTFLSISKYRIQDFGVDFEWKVSNY